MEPLLSLGPLIGKDQRPPFSGRPPVLALASDDSDQGVTTQTCGAPSASNNTRSRDGAM